MNKIEARVFYPELPATPRYREEWTAFTTLCRLLKEAGAEVVPEQFGRRIHNCRKQFEPGCTLWHEDMRFVHYYSFMDVVEMLTLFDGLNWDAYNKLKQKREDLFADIKKQREEWLEKVSK